MTLPARSASSVAATIASVDEIAPLREWHRREMQCQIVHDSFLRRGFCDSYALAIDRQTVGYGLVDHKFHPGAVDEFFVMPAARTSVPALFRVFADVSGATTIRAQTNDRLLLLMLYDCATDIRVENVLFADGVETRLPSPPGTLERKAGPEEAWQVVKDGEIVAEGGLLFHYNPPYGDIFMEVAESHRRQGYGSYLVQQLKRTAYGLGKIPAARCNADNVASRRTLERAGMVPCGHTLSGDIRRSN